MRAWGCNQHRRQLTNACPPPRSVPSLSLQGAVLRLYHGLVGSNNRRSGFKLLFFGGYQAARWTPAHRDTDKAGAGQHAGEKPTSVQLMGDPEWEVIDPKAYR